MRATLLVRDRIAYADNAFAEIVVWQVPQPLPGSTHPYKYRLAFVVDGICLLRFDNEAGKGTTATRGVGVDLSIHQPGSAIRRFRA